MADTGNKPPRETDALAETMPDGGTEDEVELLEKVAIPERYVEREALGRGGMGDVRLFEDSTIGRPVAIKTLRRRAGVGERERERFTREAIVQGQLEHPSIVPVYDLGRAGDDTFFTMRRVTGTTLADAIELLKAGEQDSAERFSRHRLLADFVRVCQAIDYAHNRGVIHRDVKPANIMFGEFGEVYVLDWGIAKASRDPEEAYRREPITIDFDSTETRADEVLGTPGYMAPEQLLGYDIDARVDVFALGCVFYEMLALESFHSGDSLKAIMEATTEGRQRLGRLAGLEIVAGPELTSICARATARDRDDRFETVAKMWRAIEDYLEGDRDLQRRRELAAERADAGRALTDQAIAGDDSARREALSQLGQALAYDPSNGDARGALVMLLVNPPTDVPEEVERAVAETMDRSTRLQAVFFGSFYVFTAAVLIPLFGWWQGVRSPTTIVLLALLFAGGGVSGLIYWRAERHRLLNHFASIVLTVLTVAVFSRYASPFLVVPGFAAVAATVFCFHYHRFIGIVATALCVAAALTPFVLEGLGVIPATFRFEDGLIKLLPSAAEFAPSATTAILIFIIIVTVMVPAVAMLGVRKIVVGAERRARLQSWQLEHLITESKA